MATGDDLDVEQLMQRAREQAAARARVPTAGAPTAGSQMLGLTGADVATLQASYDIRRVEFTSHRTILGPLIVLAKRVLRQLLTPILERQVSYNATNARVAGLVVERTDLLTRQGEGLREAIKRVQDLYRFEQRLEGLSQTTAQLETNLADEMAARESLETRLADEMAARESLETRLQAQVVAHESLETRLQQELAARESLETRLQGEVAARGFLWTRLQQEGTEWRARFLDEVRTVVEAGRALGERTSRAERKLRRILLHLTEGLEGVTACGPAAAPASQPSANALEPIFDYAGFEDRFRGDEKDIKDRQRQYMTVFEGQQDVIDIGCGRGEFLELCRDAGIRARGVELDLDMVLLCRDKGLDVVHGDAFAYIATLPDESLGGIFAAQVIEHLQPTTLIDLVKLCHRKLRVGGRAVFETPNPGCLAVFARSFYVDLTHVRPIHPDGMKFVLESLGFEGVAIRYSAPVESAARISFLPEDGVDAIREFNRSLEQLNDLIFGFQDYAVIGARASR